MQLDYRYDTSEEGGLRDVRLKELGLTGLNKLGRCTNLLGGVEYSKIYMLCVPAAADLIVPLYSRRCIKCTHTQATF
jgi:hypothetical protein